jgi:prepilin-type N-terminal cleavage/methylation domain-containing protein
MKERGFTLLEVIVVLTLFALSTLLVIPSLSGLSKTLELKEAAKKLSAILRYGRSEAVNKGEVYRILFNSELNEVKLQSMKMTEEDKEKDERGGEGPEKIYLLPKGVHIKDVKAPPPQFPSDLPVIEFYPNGGSNGGSILIDSPDRKGYRIDIHFLTGMVKMENGEIERK